MCECAYLVFVSGNAVVELLSQALAEEDDVGLHDPGGVFRGEVDLLISFWTTRANGTERNPLKKTGRERENL